MPHSWTPTDCFATVPSPFTPVLPAGKLVFMRPFKGKQKQQTVWDAVWIDAASECRHALHAALREQCRCDGLLLRLPVCMPACLHACMPACLPLPAAVRTSPMPRLPALPHLLPVVTFFPALLARFLSFFPLPHPIVLQPSSQKASSSPPP